MKKVLAIVVTLSMMLSVPAFADTTTTTQTPVVEAATTQIPTTETTPATTPATTTASVIEATAVAPVKEAGITPDSALYALDKLMERIQLSLITDAVKKAGILAEFAQERLAESNAMVDKANVELTQKALGEYKLNLELAINLIETAMEDGKDVADVMTGINVANLMDTAVVAKISASIPEEFRAEVMVGIEKVTKSTEATSETAQVIENKDEESSIKKDITNKIIEENVKDAALITKIREAGLNTRQIIALISLSEQSNKPLTEVIDLFLQNEKGIGATANKLGLTTKDALKGINESFKDKEEVVALINSNLAGQTVAPTATIEEVKIVEQKLEKVVKEAKEQVKTIVADKKCKKDIDNKDRIEKLRKSTEKNDDKYKNNKDKNHENCKNFDKRSELKSYNNDEDKDNKNDKNCDDNDNGKNKGKSYINN